jgi:hypothetical protein
MDVVEIRNRLIMLRITPEDAVALAWALRVAEFKAADTPTSAWLTAVSSCLETAALAAAAFSHCAMPEAATLTLSRLRAGQLLDPVTLAFDVAREDLFPQSDSQAHEDPLVAATGE